MSEIKNSNIKTCLDCAHCRLLIEEEAIFCFHDGINRGDMTNCEHIAQYCARYEEEIHERD